MFNFYLFTEANEETGFGHYVRTNELAKAAFQLGFRVSFNIHGKKFASAIAEDYLVSFIDWIRETDSRTIANSVVVIDTYNNVNRFIDLLLENNNRIIRIIDNFDSFDNRIWNFNPAFYSKKLIEKNYFLDKKYCIVRHDIRRIKPIVDITKKQDKVLLFLGSYPTIDIIRTILHQLDKEISANKFIVIAKSNITVSIRLINNDYNMLIDPNINQLKTEFASAKLVISSLGQSINEVLYLGIPFIGIKTATNQDNNYRELFKSGYDVIAWDDNEKFEKDFVKVLKKQTDLLEISDKINIPYNGALNFLSDVLDISVGLQLKMQR
jgi:spore coat polysaccharide biosynthesis predicted glycosyltransferase SpsG